MKFTIAILAALLMIGVAQAADPEWINLQAYPDQTICTHYAGTLGVWPPTLTEDKVFTVTQLDEDLNTVGVWTETAPHIQVSWVLDVETTGTMWLQGQVVGDGWVASTGLVAVDCQTMPEPTPTPYRVFMPMIGR